MSTIAFALMVDSMALAVNRVVVTKAMSYHRVYIGYERYSIDVALALRFDFELVVEIWLSADDDNDNGVDTWKTDVILK